jgi:hypothetical protein
MPIAAPTKCGIPAATGYWVVGDTGWRCIDAVVLFGSLLSLSVLGKGFFEELLRPKRGRPATNAV